ncbi:MAG TPA: DUF6799 domain-containing protein [Puia sp.]|nr:DUF6799 domain-containing protein [Puia sp.]
MRYLIFLAALACSLCAHAQDTTRNATARDSSRTHLSKPWDYIMMKHGQLIEVTKGVKTPVTADVILVNETTIHPDGTINDSNGKTKHLKEGKYITMDGRIRNLNRLPKGLPAQ